MVFKIGVTGRIVSGKSKLLGYLGEHDFIGVVNLDQVGHAVYERNVKVN